MKNEEDQWIHIDAESNRLNLRFRVKGYKKQFFIATGLKDNKRNREIVRLKRDAILNDIVLDRFDPTLDKYCFGVIIKNIEEPRKKEKYKYDLLELWNKFTDYQETQIEQTTILNRYVAILRYTKRLPTLSLKESPTIRDWLTVNTTKQMTRLIINHYAQCCDWAVNSQLIPDNPFTKLKGRDFRKNHKEDCRAFTLEQRDLIISSFEHHPRFSHFTELIKFLFFTGCRPGEAFALTWDDISFDGCNIKINKSCNLYNVLKNTKNGKSRIFPTAQGSKLQMLLLKMRPDKTAPGDLVFVNQKGEALKSRMVQTAWKGHKQKKNDCEYEYLGVVQELVKKGCLPHYLKPYATRHTFATWAITQGTSPDKVAKWIGDRVETVLRYYCHPEVVKSTCPDF